MLHETVMQKFNLEANAVINLSFKLSSFDFAVDITDDLEAKPNISKQYSQQSEVQNGKIFDNKESLILAVRLKAVSEEKKNEGTITRIKTDDNGVFEMLFIAIGASGLYKGTNLVAMAMDGNNQIVPIAFGICKGETGPCWSWWMSVLKEFIGDNPNLLFIFDRHAAIALAVEKEFPLAFHAPGAHKKLCRAGPQRWSRAHCPLVRYNYMTSNSVESVNACSVIYKKETVLKLAETSRAMVQECKQSGKEKDEKCDMGLSCGHVIAITRFLGLTDCVHYAADWFKNPKYQATYSESIHSFGNMHQWEFPENIQKAIPSRMDNPQPELTVLRGKDIQQDILSEYKVHISYQQAMKGKHYSIQQVMGSPYEAFEMLTYYCYNLEKKNEGTVTRIKTDDNGVFEMLFIAIGASIRTFLNYLRPVLMIDAAHLKGLYNGTNLMAVAIDGNNQIVPIAFGICKGETGSCWSWWMSGLKECIGLKNKKRKGLFWKICKAYTREDYATNMNTLQIVQPDAHEKLCRAGPQRWSLAYCPLVRYNYMTSNSVESVNACSVIYRKEPVLKLAETYRAMVQEWYYKRRQLAANEVAKKRMKSTTWVVNGVNAYQYEVSNENIQKAIPPRMDNPQLGRPKNTNRIQSQGEDVVC
nr:hypothetical protein [Tanacetum cinerariifolium]